MKQDFIVQHPETVEDIEQYIELLRKVFGPESNVDTIVRRLIDHHHGMTLEDHFIVKHSGTIVSALSLIPEKWSIGGVPLKVAEMGPVGTLPEYRRRGLIRRLVNEFHRRVEDQGYDLVAIEGIPYFYRQFGYEYAVPLDEVVRIRLDQMPDYDTRREIRPFTGRDIPQAMKFLAQSQEKFYVHSIRDEWIWKMQHETGRTSDKFEGYAVEEDGQMMAYLRIDEQPKVKELVLREVTDADQYSAQAILRFLKDVGNKRGLENLVALISYHDPFAKLLVSLGAVERIPPYAWQIRIIDYVKIFQKMKPLFEKRLAASTYLRLTEKLNFNLNCYTVQITVEKGAITNIQRLETNEDGNIRLNPLVFTQLLLGYRSRSELEMIYPDFRIRQSHRNLVDILFPKFPSYIHAVN